MNPIVFLLQDLLAEPSLKSWVKAFNRFFARKEFLEMPWLIVYILFIFTLTIALARLFNKIFDYIISRSSGEQLSKDPTSYVFLKHAGRAIIYISGFSLAVWSFPELRTLSASLLAGAGILAVAVGFASQAALANIVSGIFIVIFRPFSVKDHLTIDDTTFGVVEDITLRHTILKNQENRRVVVPNSIINAKVILNSTKSDPKICKVIEICVSYNTDLDKAIAVMQYEIFNHPFCIDNRSEEDKKLGKHPVLVKVVRLEEYAIRLRAWAWTPDNSKAYEMTMDMNKRLVERFREEQIEIPFPTRTIVLPPGIIDGKMPGNTGV